MVTIPELPSQSPANVSDDDLLIIYDMSGGTNPSRKVTLGDLFASVLRTTGANSTDDLDVAALTADTFVAGMVTATTGIIIGATLSRILTATATLTVPSLSAGASADVTMTVTGAVVNDVAVVNFLVDAADGLIIRARVSASNTVKVQITNASSASFAGASYSAKAIVLRAA